MKTIKTLFSCAVGTLMLASSINAWSQTSETVAASGGAAAAASGAQGRKTAKQADRALRKQIYAAIGKYKAIDAGDISVSARNGAVTLNGTVKDASQISQVADIARSVSGVTSITNKLTVSRPFAGSQ
jgi:hyperosmotically inducible protein